MTADYTRVVSDRIVAFNMQVRPLDYDRFRDWRIASVNDYTAATPPRGRILREVIEWGYRDDYKAVYVWIGGDDETLARVMVHGTLSEGATLCWIDDQPEPNFL